MKTMLMTLVTVAGLALTAGAAPGEGHGEGRGEGRGDGPGGKRMMAGGPGGPEAMGARILQRLLDNPEKMKELGITEEQAGQLQASFYELEKKMVTLQGDAEVAQIELRRLMDADTPDKAAVLAAVDKAGAARTAIQKAMVEQRLAVRDILGEETARKIKRLVGERMRQARGGGDDEDRPRFKQRGEGRGEQRGEGKAPWQQDQMEPPGEE